MEDAHTLVSKETLRDWRRRGGLHWVSYLATWSLQIPSLSVVGTVSLRRERQPRPAKWTTVLRLASNQQGSGRALRGGGVPDGERGRYDDGGLELVVLEPNLVDDKLTELLTYILKCMCNAGEDRGCLDAHVDLDRELQGLGCSNRIIVSHDLSSQPRVAERKTNHSQSIPRLATTRVPPFLGWPPSSKCMNVQPVTTSISVSAVLEVVCAEDED